MIWKNIKYILKNIFWSIYGVTIRSQKLPTNIQSVLFVCKGNICRSPFAEHFAVKYFTGYRNILFSSAGIYAEEHKSSTNEAIIAAKEFGVDLFDHKSRQVNYKLLLSNDLIIVMEAWHYKILRKEFPEFRGKISLLPLYENNTINITDKYSKYNIKDPFGKETSQYILCFKKIASCIIGLSNKVQCI